MISEKVPKQSMGDKMVNVWFFASTNPFCTFTWRVNLPVIRSSEVNVTFSAHPTYNIALEHINNEMEILDEADIEYEYRNLNI